MRIVITKVRPGEGPVGKLADAAVDFGFGREASFMAGLKIVGFSMFEAAGGGVKVELPSRRYTVCGERRQLALVRPAERVLGESATDGLVRAIKEAYARHLRAEAAAD